MVSGFFYPVQKQYLTNHEVGGEEGRRDALRIWRNRSRLQAKRKQGESTAGDPDAPARKRRRVKAFATMMTINNMLECSAGVGIDHFVITRSTDGRYPDPFSWPHLNLACDQGSDNMAMAHYLAYERGAHVHCDWDVTHGCHNDLCKEMLKTQVSGGTPLRWRVP